MKEYKCCVCGEVMEEKVVGLEFAKFTEAETPLYRKLYAYFCTATACNCFRQVEDEGADI